MLLSLFLAAIGLAPPASAGGQGDAGQAKHFRVVPVRENVYAAIAAPGDRDSVGNAGFIVGKEGVVVVDAFATRAGAEELLAEIRRRTSAPVRWVVNTHYHFDHVGGDAVFARAGASVVAHENERAWVRTENLKWRKEITAEDREMLAHLVLPDVTHRDGLTIWLGDRRIDVLSRPG